MDCRQCNLYLCETCLPQEQAAQEEAAVARAAEGQTSEQDAMLEDRVWSSVVEIDQGFPFDAVWPALKQSVLRALRSVHTKWPEMGWRSELEFEACLRASLEADGTGTIARGLLRPEAELVVQHLQGQLQCSVRRDMEGAAAARAIWEREASPRSDSGAAEHSESGSGNNRREKLRRRLREVRELSEELTRDHPLSDLDILGRIERDLEDDERWRSRASVMERALAMLEGAMRGLDPLELLFDGRVVRSERRRAATLTVDRQRLLCSALAPVLGAAPEDLRPGRVQVKYSGEEAEDGEGGGGVTRAFLTQAGRLLGAAPLGLLLPALGGHLQLSPLPGFLVPQGLETDAVCRRPERWARFLGRILGMAVAHECPLGLLLVPSLCKQLLGQETSFEDVQFVPGLNDGAAGWYNSLKVLLAHRAPGLVKDDATMVRLETHEIDQALLGLEAVMPSKSRQVFDSLVAYVSDAAHSPEMWEGALGVAACLLQAVRTGADTSHAQVRMALLSTKALVEGLTAGRVDLSIGIKRKISSLRTVLNGVTQTLPEASEVRRLLEHLDDAEELQCEVDELEFSEADEDDEDSLCTLEPPTLKRDVSEVRGVGLGSREQLTAENLPTFAAAVAHKALDENLQPHLSVVVEEFRRVVVPKVLHSLSWLDVQDRLSGQRLDPNDFVREWRKRTTYEGCVEADRRVQLWWDHVSERGAEELGRLFAWCTGYAAAPVTAWKFQIQAVDDAKRCPTVNTCLTDDPSAANRGVKRPTLYLPAYDSEVELARRLEWAVAGACAMLLH